MPRHWPDAEVTFVLGGGGAKGIAHIGVFKAIHECRLCVNSIVGTSIGAIWASLFATLVSEQSKTNRDRKEVQGKAIAAVEQHAYQLRFAEYLDLALLRLFAREFVKGDKFEDWLTTQFWSKEGRRALTFRDVDFDLNVTATDAITGESLVLNLANTPDLSLAKAVRASMSIQGFFAETVLDIPSPATGENRSVRCWDGGTTGNCRFDLGIRRHPTRPVIASSLTYRGEPVEVNKGIVRAFWRLSRTRDHSISILMRQIEQLLLDNLNVGQRLLLLRPPLQGLTTFDLNAKNRKKAAVIAASQAYARDQISAFVRGWNV